MIKLSQILNRIASPKTFALALGLYVSFVAGIMPWLATFMPEMAQGAEPIDLQFAPSPDVLFALVDSYGNAGRKTYALFELTADVIYPIVYAMFLSITLTLLIRRLYGQEGPISHLNLLPFSIVIADYLENMGIISLLMTYPERHEILAHATRLFNAAKWSLVFLTFAVIVIGVILLPFKRVQKIS